MIVEQIVKKIKKLAQQYGLYVQTYHSKNFEHCIMYIATQKNDAVHALKIHISLDSEPIHPGEFYITANKNDYKEIKKAIKKLGKKQIPFLYTYLIVFPEYKLFPKNYKIFKVKKSLVKKLLKEIPEIFAEDEYIKGDLRIFTPKELEQSPISLDVQNSIQNKNYILYTESVQNIEIMQYLREKYVHDNYVFNLGSAIS